MTLRKQRLAMLIAAALTALAALLGLVFATLVSGGMTRPVRRLLEGVRAIESGHLDETLARHLEGRDRPLDHRLQPDGRAVAPQGAYPRDLRQMSTRASSKD